MAARIAPRWVVLGSEPARAPGAAASGFAASRGSQTERLPACTRRRRPVRRRRCSWRSCHSAHSPRRVLGPGMVRQRRGPAAGTGFAATRWQQIRHASSAIAEHPEGRSPTRTSAPSYHLASRSTSEPARNAQRHARRKTSVNLRCGR